VLLPRRESTSSGARPAASARSSSPSGARATTMGTASQLGPNVARSIHMTWLQEGASVSGTVGSAVASGSPLGVCLRKAHSERAAGHLGRQEEAEPLPTSRSLGTTGLRPFTPRARIG